MWKQHCLRFAETFARKRGTRMATDRIRQVLSGPINWDQVKAYQNEGWRVTAIEWERDVLGTAHIAGVEAPPYGLRVAQDCAKLEEEPNEREILVSMME